MAAPGSWFRTGTVTVTNGSNMVVGFGTAWRTSATPPEVGDIFSVDGKALYEIIAIPSETSIKLHKQYDETTASKTPYGIIRNTSATINTRLAAQVTLALNQKQVMIDEQSQWLTSTKATEDFTDPLGVAHPVMTPHAMEESVTNKVTEVDNKLNEIAQQYAMTEPQWEALRQKCESDDAGSGFSEWGMARDNGSAFIAINKGLYTYTASPNALRMGYSGTAEAVGTSKSASAEVRVAGIKFLIENGLGGVNGATIIELPEAPNGTKQRDSATGAVTEHATSNEVFEGLITNGDFRNGTAGWTNHDSAFVVTNGIANVNGSSADGRIEQSSSHPAGTYTLRVVARATVPAAGQRIQLYAVTGTGLFVDIDNSGVFKEYTTEITTTATDDIYSILRARTGTIEIASSSLMPATEQVITSRKDLVGFKVQKKVDMDLYDVYFPGGSTQYGASTWNGIPLVDVTTLGVPQALCGFGEWDTVTKGKGVKFSTLSDADKKKIFANDPNVRFDVERNKLVFSLIKAISVEGPGDTWEDPRLGKYDGKAWLSSALDKDWSTTQDYQLVSNDVGRKDGTHSIFIPICLSGSLNQGLYSGEYNSEGSGCVGSGKYLVDYRPKSKAECFANAENGSIASGKSGNPSQYKYHDARYSGMVEDLRSSSHVQDESKLREDFIRNSVAGAMRGKGKVPFCTFSASTEGAANVTGRLLDRLDNNLKVGDFAYIETTTGYVRKVLTAVDHSAGSLQWSGALAVVDNCQVVTHSLTTAEYDSLPCVSLICDPVRGKATFPNGVVGEWSTGIPDATTRADLTRKSNESSLSITYTDDDGATWSHTTVSVDVTTNTIGALDVGRVALLNYESLSEFTKAANNSKVVGKAGDVFEGCSYKIECGNRLQSSLADIGKSSVDKYFGRLSLDSYTIQADGLIEPNPAYSPKHAAIDLAAPNNSSKGVKAEYSLTEIDGFLYGQFNGCSMSHDGTDWGDDGKVPIVNMEGAKTDDNGVTQKTFCHHTIFPLGIASYNNSAQAKE